MEILKKFFGGFLWNWFLKGQVLGLLKKLDGHKTFSGILLMVIQAAVLQFGADASFLDVLIQGLKGIGAENPLSVEEMNVVLSTLWTAYGALHKLWKLGKKKVAKSKEEPEAQEAGA